MRSIAPKILFIEESLLLKASASLAEELNSIKDRDRVWYRECGAVCNRNIFIWRCIVWRGLSSDTIVVPRKELNPCLIRLPCTGCGGWISSVCDKSVCLAFVSVCQVSVAGFLCCRNYVYIAGTDKHNESPVVYGLVKDPLIVVLTTPHRQTLQERERRGDINSVVWMSELKLAPNKGIHLRHALYRRRRLRRSWSVDPTVDQLFREGMEVTKIWMEIL